MKLRYKITLLCLLLATVASIATAGQKHPLWTPPQNRPFNPSPVIYGDESIPLRFYHDKHIAEDMDCTDCHTLAAASVRASDKLVPHGAGEDGMEICTNCHDVEDSEADPAAKCSTCHNNYVPKWSEGQGPADFASVPNPPAPVVIPTANLKMNHKIHMDRGIKCTECHGKMTNIQVATRDNSLPLMSTCLTCHDGSKASAECRTCHISRPDGRLKATFGTGVLKPAGHYRNDAHDDNYLRSHASTAKGDEAYCAQCHEEKYCLECHNGVSRPLKVHPNNWIMTHPLSARRNNPTCSSCHRTQSYCVDCHKRMGVARGAEFSNDKAGLSYNKAKFGSFHPPGWVSDGALKSGTVKGANHHAIQAQRNIRACAACHTENTCIGCHESKAMRSGSGIGVNPHGPRFGQSRKCRSLKKRNSRVCTKCHVTVPDCK